MGITCVAASSQRLTLLASSLSILNNKAAATIASWVTPLVSFPGSNDKRILSFSDGSSSGGTRFSVGFGPSGGISCAGKTVDANTAQVFNSTASPLVIQTTYHIAVVMDCIARVFRVYKNGALVDTSGTMTNWTSANYSNTNSIAGAVGAKAAEDSQFLDGDFQDLRLYNRALTAPEIKSLYHENGVDSIFNGLVMRYLISEKQSGFALTGANIIYDKSNSHINGTPVNGPTISGSYRIWRKLAN